MKVILITIFVFGLTTGMAGCTQETQVRFAEAFVAGQQAGQQKQQEMQRPVQIIAPQQQNSTYWQETRARQEYFDSLHPNLWKPK